MKWFHDLIKNHIFKMSSSFQLTGSIDPFQFQPKSGTYGNNYVTMHNFQITDSNTNYIGNAKFDFIPIFPVIVRIQYTNINLFIWNEV